jgi:hypothetical protein
MQDFACLLVDKQIILVSLKVGVGISFEVSHSSHNPLAQLKYYSLV